MRLWGLLGALWLVGWAAGESASTPQHAARAATALREDAPLYHYDWKEELQLSPEQLESFRKILHDYRMQNRFIQADYTRLFVLNRNLFDHSSYDFEYYKLQALEIEKQRIEIERDFFQKTHAILSPKQREIFSLNIEEWSIRR